jgi:hypothetical protein
MRSLLVASTLVALAGCAPPSIGSYPDTPDEPPADPTPTAARSATPPPPGTVAADGTRPKGKPTLTVTLVGTGTITSTPAGLTCTSTTCTGAFDAGTTVVLTATPTAGSFFGSWSGACTGALACSAAMTGDVAIGADFESLTGTWTGPYTHQETVNGCTFNNAGTLTVVASPASGTSVPTSAKITGLQIKNGCNLTGTKDGTANANATFDSGTVTGTWNFQIPNVPSLPLPFSAKVSGKTMTGTWTCAGCTGSFTIAKP